MSEESPRGRKKRQRNPDATAYSTGVLVQFTDKVPSPDSPEYLTYQERLNRRRLEREPDLPFIVDESKPDADQPPTA